MNNYHEDRTHRTSTTYNICIALQAQDLTNVSIRERDCRSRTSRAPWISADSCFSFDQIILPLGMIVKDGTLPAEYVEEEGSI
jgi:hypothetical protein